MGKPTYIPCSYHWDSTGQPINLMGKPTNIPCSYYWDLTGQPINLMGKPTHIPCFYHWDSTGQPINLMGKPTHIPYSYHWDLTGQLINSVGKPTRIQCCGTRHPKSCKTGAAWSTIIHKTLHLSKLEGLFLPSYSDNRIHAQQQYTLSKHITDHFNLELGRERFRISFFWTGFRLDLAQWSTIWPLRFPKSTSLHLLVARFFFISSEKTTMGNEKQLHKSLAKPRRKKRCFLQRPWLHNLSSTCTLVTLLRLRIRRITMIYLC